MSAINKPRADARLKILPAERQAEIFEHMRDHKLAETRSWLREDGLSVGMAALSEFYSWYQLSQQLQRNESTVATVLEDLRKSNPGMTAEQIEQAGQAFFSALAIQEGDSLTWKRVQDSKSKRQALKLLERRIVLLERKAQQADEAAGVMGDKTLTESQRAARMKEIFGISQ